jgi:hypothetical protein
MPERVQSRQRWTRLDLSPSLQAKLVVSHVVDDRALALFEHREVPGGRVGEVVGELLEPVGLPQAHDVRVLGLD